MADGKKVNRRSVRVFKDESYGYLAMAAKDYPDASRRTLTEEKEIEAEKSYHSSRSSSSSSHMGFRIGSCGNLQSTSQKPVRTSETACDKRNPSNVKIDGYPVNFGAVAPGIYRSGFPTDENFGCLKRLGLKTILTFVSNDFPATYQTFLETNCIRNIVIEIEGTKKAAIPPTTMYAIIEVLLDRQNHPLLMHCNHGKHRTGCVAAVYRKLTGWTLDTVIEEYRYYSHPKARESDVNYITAFDITSLGGISNAPRRYVPEEAKCGFCSSLQKYPRGTKMAKMLALTGAIIFILVINYSCFDYKI